MQKKRLFFFYGFFTIREIFLFGMTARVFFGSGMLAIGLGIFFSSFGSFVFSAPAGDEDPMASIVALEKSLTYQKTGSVDIKNAFTVTIPEGFSFLNGSDAQKVLEAWGNPPDNAVLGMLLPNNTTAFDENSTYVAVLTYNEEGYVKDDDAKDMDFNTLFTDMQTAVHEQNEELVKQGYQSRELVKWASPPYYDAQNKKLHWAKEFHFEGENENTLNYDVRVLGRYGYISISLIASPDLLPDIGKDIPLLVKNINFTEGNRYEDFNPAMDRVAEYGIAALIAGGLLSKTGIFAVILKSFKLILLAVFGGFALFWGRIKQWYTGKKPETISSDEETPNMPSGPSQ